MTFSICCYPPLGQVSIVPPGLVTIYAALDIHPNRTEDQWHVSLWHSIDGKKWSETPFSKILEGSQPSCLQILSSPSHRLFMSAVVDAKKSVYFTLKFRPGAESDWKWIQDDAGIQDGIILVDSLNPAPFSGQLKDYIPDLNAELRPRSVTSCSPKTQLWSIGITAPRERGDAISRTDFNLGTPWGSFLRWFALVRLWEPWIGPEHGKTHFQLDKDAIMCSFQSPEGVSMVFLGLSGINDVSAVFRSSGSGQVLCRIRNDGAEEEIAHVLISVGRDFGHAVAAVAYEARNMIMRARDTTSLEVEKTDGAVSDVVESNWTEKWYDGLGYCTWNSLGQRLTAEKIYTALDTLDENDITITSLIIDDNWQSIDYEGDGQFQHGWVDFEAEPNDFPDGLRDMVQKIRLKHHSIKHVAVWHALLGYWGGISPKGKLASKYKTIEVMREEYLRRNFPMGGKMTIIAKDDVHRFYEDFYYFLRNSGIDAVKTDAQFMPDMWTSSLVRRDHIKTYIDAWTQSTLRYFGEKAISCMSQTPTMLFYSLMASNRPAFLFRNSDDYSPDVPSSQTWHVFANACNALFTRHLNVLPDWDMFQTLHDYSGFHAAARCVSGGPIYITDVPGQHDVDLIAKMTGLTPRSPGKTVIFRNSVGGRSIDPYVGYHDNVLLKVGSYHGDSMTGTPILGVFNISRQQLTELISLSRFPGVVPDVYYVVRAHTSGLVTGPVQIGSCAGSLISLSLGVAGYEIFTAYPLTAVDSKKHGAAVWVSALGLVDKMASGATLAASLIKTTQGMKVHADVHVKALGVFGLYISVLPKLVLEKDFIATLQGKVIPFKTVSVSKVNDTVLEIDLMAAWKDMALEMGRSNNVRVQVWFTYEQAE